MNNLRIHLPGAVDGTIKLEIYNAMNDFFQDSNVWRENIDFMTSPGESSYQITPSGPSTFVRLMGVADENQYPVGGYMDLVTGDLVLSDTPANAVSYVAQVSLTLNEPLNKEGFPFFPPWVLNLYMTDMISGVLSRMLSQPAKPYSNVQLAAYHGAAFRGAIAKARAEANRRYTYRSQMWRFPRGWSRSKSHR